MNRFVLVIAVLAVSIGPALRADAQGVVKFPDGPLAWSVTVKYHDQNDEESSVSPSQPARRRFAAIQIERAGNLRRDRVQWTDGTKSETWWSMDPAFVMFEDPRIGGILASPPDYSFDRMRLDETAFNWIRSSQMAKEVRYLGRPCFYYQAEERTSGREGDQTELVQVSSLPAGEDSSAARQAWIDRETGLPVALIVGGQATYLFSFSETPPETLTLPSKFAALLDRHAAIMAPSPISSRKRLNRN
jgi:hypothetical protein